MRVKKLVKTAVMAAMLLTAVAMQPGKQVEAAAYSNLMVSEGASEEVLLAPGESLTVELPVRAVKELILNPKFSVELPEGAPFEVSKISVSQVVNGEKLSGYKNIGLGMDSILEFTVTAKETAKIGKYEFALCYTDYQWDGEVITEGSREYDQRVTVTAVVAEEKMPAELAISDLSVSGELKPGGVAELSFTVCNTGELTAKNVCLSGDYSGGMLLPEYTDYTRKLGDMAQGQVARVSLKVKVLSGVSQPVVTLPLQMTYKDSDGSTYEAAANNILYLEVTLPKEEKEPAERGSLLVNSVKQVPENPKAGEKVTVSFIMENTGKKEISEVKLYPVYMPNTGFEPVSADPYVYVGNVKAGERKNVSLQVFAGKDMGEGMNVLGMEYTYLEGEGEKASETVNLYVLRMQKREDGATIGKPKLMVTEFFADRDEIKTGEEFNFTFKVYNTHKEIPANNIKVTLTSEVFAVTKGSNSFFVQEIKPGQSEEIVINLKASAAATTGSYPVGIQMEYEYDGMEKNESGTDGVVVTETKMLPIKENLRVSVEDMMVGHWDEPMVGQNTPLSFSVYNMGKSLLNNVYFTVEGDFSVANGSSYYYGNLQPGYPDFVEMDIIPLVEGDAVGTLTVHMEDSNGDEVTYQAEINAYIGGDSFSGEMLPEDNWEMPVDGDWMENEPEEPKKSVFGSPLLLGGIGAGVLVLGIVLGVVIGKRKKKDADEYED